MCSSLILNKHHSWPPCLETKQKEEKRKEKLVVHKHKTTVVLVWGKLAQFLLSFYKLCQLTVPSRTNLPDELVTGLAVCAVRGVRMACSMVPGRPPCVPGRTKPLSGRPDWLVGLRKQIKACWASRDQTAKKYIYTFNFNIHTQLYLFSNSTFKLNTYLISNWLMNNTLCMNPHPHI